MRLGTKKKQLDEDEEEAAKSGRGEVLRRIRTAAPRLASPAKALLFVLAVAESDRVTSSFFAPWHSFPLRSKGMARNSYNNAQRCRGS